MGAPRPATVRPTGLAAVSGEVSGAFGDLGTFLPYVVAILGAGLLAPGPVFWGFAAGYLMVAVLYRLPVAVQPMKALGAMLIAGGLGAVGLAWAGALIGALLLVFAASPALGRAARAVPQSVVTGLQAGLGLMLGAVAVSLMAQDWRLAAPALAALALALALPRGPWALAVVMAGALLAPQGLAPPPEGPPPAVAPVPQAILAGLLAQVPLTLLNAVVVTVAVAQSLFPRAERTVTARRLAATSGVLNLVAAPFGALPMCHGAGGAAAHHRFGARGIGAPLILAGLCAAAALAGPRVIALLAAIPMPVVGALLAWAAADLILSRRMFDARRDCQPVIAATAAATFAAGALAGLLAGLAAEALRRHIVGARRARSAAAPTTATETGQKP